MGKKKAQKANGKGKMAVCVGVASRCDPSLMPLAHALVGGSVEAVGEWIKGEWQRVGLPREPPQEGVVVEKNYGEAFTGGRSTPVYSVSVPSFQWKAVVKLVQIKEASPIISQSYSYEATFYRRVARELEGVRIPKCLYMEQSKDQSSFLFFMNDLRSSHPQHPSSLSLLQSKLALTWVAKFHGALALGESKFESFLAAQSSNPKTKAQSQVWTSGTFWDLGKSSHRHSLESVGPSFQKCLLFLNKKFPDISARKGMKSLGNRIRACAQAVNAFVHPTDSSSIGDAPELQKLSKCRLQQITILHGDLKAANLFFNAESCAGVDFQYSGLGLGVVDLAYFLFPDAKSNFVREERALLAHYHSALCTAQPLFFAYSLQTLFFDYQVARLDLLRYNLAKGWVATTPAEAASLDLANQFLATIDNGGVLTKEQYAQRILAEQPT